MKRKILNLLLTVLMAVAAFSMNSEAAETEEITIVEEIISCTNAATFAAAEEEIEVVDAGYCGNADVMWGITTDGILLIVGEGMMSDWEWQRMPWLNYKDSIYGVVVAGTVKNIGANSFGGCSNLMAVVIEEGLTTIGEAAFAQCDSLEVVVLPSTVTVIEDEAFQYCSSLTEIELPQKIKSISKQVFKDCDNLTKVTVPNSVKTIGEGAFYRCYSLTSITIPDTVTTIGEEAFYDSGLTSITIPSSVKKIGPSTFAHCTNLKTVKISSGITEIGTQAFGSCQALEKISIPNTVTSLGEAVFKGCINLKEVDLPDYITAIPHSMFDYCLSLSTITIPSQVTEIASEAFSQCKNLTTIRIPANVTRIGEAAFAECVKLQKISIMNPELEFGINVFEEPGSDLLIRCIENSTAHTYAVENNHPYELIDISLVTEYFADVEYETWYVDYIQYVYDNGIMQGIGGELFAPYGKVTRAMVVETLYKLEERPEVEDYSEFEMLTDLDREDWWASSVAWALDKGVATGDTYFMTFNPEDPVTREQLATFLYRYAKYKGLDTSAQDSLSGLLNAENVNEWAEDAVKWVVGEELITGVEILDEVTKEVIALDLAPQGNATRAQLATILTRFCGKYNN